MTGAANRSARIAAAILGGCVLLDAAGPLSADPLPPFPAALAKPISAVQEAAPAPVMSDAAAPVSTAVNKPASGSAVPGSRLLQALQSQSSQPTKSGGPADPSGLPVSAAEGCPRDLLSRLLAGAVNEAGALSALGIEQETLKLCLERQQIVAGLFEQEAQLRALRTSAAPSPAAAAPASSEIRIDNDARSAPEPVAAPPGEPAQLSPLRAALVDASRDTATPDAPVEPGYGWFSIIGASGVLRAGVTDGRRVWFVRAGDPLPGGVRIAAIAARPPGVLVTDTGETDERQSLLPYRNRPGDGQ